MNENTSVAEAGTLILKDPSAAVNTPFCVPFSFTVTPGNSVPLTSLTVPATGFFSCAQTCGAKQKVSNVARRIILRIASLDFNCDVNVYSIENSYPLLIDS